MPRTITDQRVNTRLDRWQNLMEEAGTPINRMEAWKPFLAGWQARLEAALEEHQVWGNDDSVVKDHLSNVQKQVDRVWDDWWKMRGLLQQKQNLLDAWTLAKDEQRQDRHAVRDGKADKRLLDLPLWKRISMQRKELKALHHEIAWRDSLIKRQRAELEELRKQS